MQDVTVRGEDGLPIVPAGETTQGQILAELQQKTEPADIQKVGTNSFRFINTC